MVGLSSEIIITTIMENVRVVWRSVRAPLQMSECVVCARCLIIEHTFSNDNFIQNFYHFDVENVY